MSRGKHRNIKNFFHSGDIDKYKYLPCQGILPCDQSRIIEQAKFTYIPLGKAFEKQTKMIEEQGEKQIKYLKSMEKKN